MGYIKFDKDKLINLSYSLDKELLRTNRRGSYASSTLILCNTRKYHGLLIAPQPNIDEDLHVLLSSVDATIIQHNSEFNLGIHQFPGNVFIPKGHKYVRELQSDPIPKTVYRVGGVVFSVESIFSRDSDRILLKYTLEDCHSETTLRLKPFLAFRQRHQLSKANEWADKKFKEIANGVSFRLYQGYSTLFMQFSKKVDYVHVPDWHYNVEYIEELRRGYEGHEDLLVPGYFEMTIKKGESVILSAGLEEIKPASIPKMFDSEVASRVPRSSFINCLHNSAQQFVRHQDDKAYIVAGFPWFGNWGRDTFISLPGLNIALKDDKTYTKIIDTMIQNMNGPLFVNFQHGDSSNYASADAPLWFIWAVQQFYYSDKNLKKIKKSWYKTIKTIIEGYIQGTDFNIHMAENKLIWAGESGKALTWMDAIVAGKPVTPRIGFNVEINSLWFNSLSFALEIANEFSDKDFIKKYSALPAEISENFKNTFWDKEKGYLADYTDGDLIKDWSIRPNMIFATSLPYSPISLKIRQLILAKVIEHLLTERGIRSLSPRNPLYKGVCEGNQSERDLAYHQGTVWPWIFGHFVEGYLKVHGHSGVRKMQWYLEKFEEVMLEHGIGSISEIYDGDPPHTPRGCISQAWSVAEILRAHQIIENYLNTSK
jgi:predicted glycogen debranching enzyme